MVDNKVPLSSICHNYNLYITRRGKPFAEEEKLNKLTVIRAEYIDAMKKEMAEKEAARSAALAGSEDVKVNLDEDTEEDDGTAFRIDETSDDDI